MADIFPAKLLSSIRDDVVDEEYFGFIFLYDDFSLIKKYGDDRGAKFYLRSLSKPIQASLMADFNTADYYKFTSEEIAIICASHAGTKIHTELVRSILNKACLDENSLKCPKTAPLDAVDYDGIRLSVYHNCSAKHALMLALCVQNGWDRENYTDFLHPLQKLIYKKHLELSGAKSASISLDGCGTPVFALKIDEIARMFFKLFNDKKYDFIKKAMVQNPYIAGGNNRLDSEIMTLGALNLVSKVGAGGFVLIYSIRENKILIVKMSQNNNEARRIIALNALYELGWINSNPAPREVFNSFDVPVAKYVCNFSFS